jgi:hypothetical protein
LVSRTHQRQLSCDDAGNLSTSDHRYGQWETWRLEPRLPGSLNGSQIAAMGLAGAVGVALTVAMPFAVGGIIEAAGLTATQLAVGVSAEALVAVGGGALLGAGVVGTTAVLVDQQTSTSNDQSLSTQQVMEENVTNSSRPISTWRTW